VSAGETYLRGLIRVLEDAVRDYYSHFWILWFPKEQDWIKAMQRTVNLVSSMLELWGVNR